MLSMWDAAAHSAQESTRSCLWIFQLLCSATIPLVSLSNSHILYTVHENLNMCLYQSQNIENWAPPSFFFQSDSTVYQLFGVLTVKSGRTTWINDFIPIQMRRVLKPMLAHPLAEVSSAPAGPNNAEDQGNFRPRELIVFCFMRHWAAFIGLNRAPPQYMFEPQLDSEKSLQRGSLSLYGVKLQLPWDWEYL